MVHLKKNICSFPKGSMVRPQRLPISTVQKGSDSEYIQKILGAELQRSKLLHRIKNSILFFSRAVGGFATDGPWSSGNWPKDPIR